MFNFEVGEEYANRKGSYTVLEISDSKMMVEYDDGSTADLSITIQQRIWENIVTEREVERTRTVKSRKKRVTVGTRYYIKPTSMMTVEELSTTNKQEGIPASGRWLAILRRGDRLLYYAKETQLFFAVVTITGPGKKPKGRGRKKTSILYFPVDVDAYVVDLSKALLAVSVDLESQPKYKEILADSDDYLEITEDEFELLAEILAEVSEEVAESNTNQEKDDDEFEA
jgi:hypothetical protein